MYRARIPTDDAWHPVKDEYIIDIWYYDEPTLAEVIEEWKIVYKLCPYRLFRPGYIVIEHV